MIQIERLRMHLPSGFQHRATSIALLIGEQLAKINVSKDVSLESILIKPQRLTMNNSDAEIANLIVEQIVSDTGRQQT